ncbi:hypothetical protein D3C84_766790 [compost metagenome]
MRLQVLVDDRGEVEQRALNRRAGNAGLIGLAHRQQFTTGGNDTTGLAPRIVLDAVFLARLHNPHQLAKCVEAAWKTGVGVELHQYFLRLADGQARVQPLIQCSIQLRHVAAGHVGSNQRDGLLPRGQHLGSEIFGGH